MWSRNGSHRLGALQVGRSKERSGGSPPTLVADDPELLITALRWPTGKATRPRHGGGRDRDRVDDRGFCRVRCVVAVSPIRVVIVDDMLLLPRGTRPHPARPRRRRRRRGELERGTRRAGRRAEPDAVDPRHPDATDLHRRGTRARQPQLREAYPAVAILVLSQFLETRTRCGCCKRPRSARATCSRTA